MLRTLMTALATFVVCALAAYLVVFLGTVAFWEVTGATDRDGGHGMGLVLGVAPLLAIVTGMVGAVVAGRRTHRRLLNAAPDVSERRFGRAAGALAGALALYVPTKLVFWIVLGRNTHDVLWKTVAHAWTPTLLALAGAAAGWLLTQRPRLSQ